MSTTETLYFSVITTNSGNLEFRLPADTEEWTAADQRKWRKLERAAEAAGTYIGRHSYPLLES